MIRRFFSAFGMPIAGLMFLAAAAGLMLWWDQKGRAHYEEVSQLVLAADVNRGMVVNANQLITRRVEPKMRIQAEITDPMQIVGLTAVQYIPKDVPLVARYFAPFATLTGAKRAVMQIPANWIISMPGTLRRLDRIQLVPVWTNPNRESQPGRRKTNATDSAGNSMISKPKTKSKPAAFTSTDTSGTILPFKTVVAYVRDGANREVVSTDPADRLDGSSVIRHLEVFCSVDQFGQWEQTVEAGYRFVVMADEP